jgi:signal transduction histidine kinase
VGAIFVADEATNTLELRAHRGMGDEVRTRCTRVAFGSCVCGRAAETGELQMVASEEAHHQGGHPHGHYCVPIEQSDRVLGVLNVYLQDGHKRDPNEVEFLRSVAAVLAGVIQRNRAIERQLAHEHIALSRERMARLGEIAAGVAHTVRNPLHGVQNCADILEARLRSDDPEVIETLALMREGFERIDKVTRRLLSFTRDAAARPQPTSVADLLADVDRMMAQVATARGVTLHRGPAPEAEFALDADRVAEALFNVVGNAIDACRAGDRVEMRALASDGGGLTIEVEDTGEGIPPEHLGRVLDPFFTTKPLGEGSGLGLAITRGVMDQHQGSVAIHSEVGVGTTIQLIFPPPAND